MTGMLIINYTFDENRDGVLVEIVRFPQFLLRDYNRAVSTKGKLTFLQDAWGTICSKKCYDDT